VSRPFEYRGYTEAEFAGFEKSSEYVVMEDGTKIAVDVFLPSDGPTGGPFPTVFQYTPYGRAVVKVDGDGEEVLDRVSPDAKLYGSTSDIVRNFLAHGYAYAIADMRGTGASSGWNFDFMPEFAQDGFELVDWIDAQPWSDGNVGMFGGSYLGFSQLATASKQPEALKAIFPEVVPLDGYTGEIRPGGIFLWTYSQESGQVDSDDERYLAAPVVDEDGDGQLSDEIPIDLNGNGEFHDDYAFPDDPTDVPRYADGQEREHVYFLATSQHDQGPSYSEIGPALEFIDFSYPFGPGAFLAGIRDSGIPVYNHGSWMDPFIRGTTEWYATLKDTNPSKMVIDPGYHEGPSPYWEYLGEDETEMLARYGTEMLRYFDRYLKGIRNGIDTEPPISIYTMNGEGWRSLDEWPLAEETKVNYFLDAEGSLTSSQGAPGADDYEVNFTHDARWPAASGAMVTRWIMESPKVVPSRTDLDEKVLSYTTRPLDGDTEVTGHPVINLWVSSTEPNGDFFVYLEDVDESGEAVLVTEGLLRAGFHELHDNDTMPGPESQIDIEPELPWHGFEQGQYDPQVLANGKVVELAFDLLPTSWVFREGHSIRISIAGADHPTFAILPELSPSNDPKAADNKRPVVTVHRSAAYPSRITLPVIPAG
jgi:predicted acyl esterase